MEQIELDYSEDAHSPSSETSEIVVVTNVNSEEASSNESQRITALEQQLDHLEEIIIRELPHLNSVLDQTDLGQDTTQDAQELERATSYEKPPISERVTVPTANDLTDPSSATGNTSNASDQNSNSGNHDCAQWRPMFCHFCGEKGFSDSCRNVISAIQRAEIAQRDHLCLICLKPHRGICRKQLKCIYCDKPDHHRALCGTIAAYEGRGELAHHC